MNVLNTYFLMILMLARERIITKALYTRPVLLFCSLERDSLLQVWICLVDCQLCWPGAVGHDGESGKGGPESSPVN